MTANADAPRPYQTDARCPLDGVRVLDLSRVVAGNMLSLQLADFGAEVIKIEAPGQGDTLREWKEDGVALFWKVYSRNKKSVGLDIRKGRGREIFSRLVETAQVLIENFRPGVLERLGFAPERLHELNPKLVIVRVSGWGQTGPYSHKPGFGSLVEGLSGFAAKNGFPDKPPALPNLALADMIAGLSGAFATLVALREVEVGDGAGQVVDLSLLEPIVSTLGPDLASYRWTGRIPPRTGNRSVISAPRNLYLTRDGHWLALSASTQQMTERLLKAVGREDMVDDPRFATNAARVRHIDLLDEAIGGFIGGMTRDEALAYFESREVTVGPVCDTAGVAEDPHVRGREVFVDLVDDEVGSLPMHQVVPRLSLTPGAIRRPAPALGEHTGEVLAELGFDADALQALRNDRII